MALPSHLKKLLANKSNDELKSFETKINNPKIRKMKGYDVEEIDPFA